MTGFLDEQDLDDWIVEAERGYAVRDIEVVTHLRHQRDVARGVALEALRLLPEDQRLKLREILDGAQEGIR